MPKHAQAEMVNKRLIATTTATVVSGLLLGLNTKLGLGLPEEAVLVLAGNIGVAVGGYLWSQAKTDVAEGK